MQFAMGFEVQLADPTVEREHQLIHDSVEQAVFAEEMGFDRVWAPEHHSLKWYAHMSAPEIFLTWVAAKTSRIRVGHGVVLMPFNYNHPVRVAERAAMLDALSGGSARPRRRTRGHAAGDVAVRRGPRADLPRGRGVPEDDLAHVARRRSSAGTAS